MAKSSLGFYYSGIRREACKEWRRITRRWLPLEVAMTLGPIGVYAAAVLPPWWYPHPTDEVGAVVLAAISAMILLAMLTAGTFLWTLAWAPVNHARELTREHEHRDEIERRVLEQFDHLYWHGNLLKSMLAMMAVQTDELQLANWRGLALKWERFLKEHAEGSLARFEAQRLWSDAGLTLHGLPGASKTINKYHRRMDAVMQRLESLIERRAWQSDAE